MLDFFNALSDLLESDLVKGHIATIVIAELIVVLIVAALTWLICVKIFCQVKLNQAYAKESQFSEFTSEIQKLKMENEKLQQQLKKYEFESILDNDKSQSFEDLALDKFKRKKK